MAGSAYCDNKGKDIRLFDDIGEDDDEFFSSCFMTFGTANKNSEVASSCSSEPSAHHPTTSSETFQESSCTTPVLSNGLFSSTSTATTSSCQPNFSFCPSAERPPDGHLPQISAECWSQNNSGTQHISQSATEDISFSAANGGASNSAGASRLPLFSAAADDDEIQILSASHKSQPQTEVASSVSGSSSAISVSNSGTPMMGSINGTNMPFQLVNGQLVVQAQLQTVQTPNGIMTVAVLPSSLMKQPMALQMQQNGRVNSPSSVVNRTISSSSPVIRSNSKPATPTPILPASNNTVNVAALSAVSGGKIRKIQPRPQRKTPRISAARPSTSAKPLATPILNHVIQSVPVTRNSPIVSEQQYEPKAKRNKPVQSQQSVKKPMTVELDAQSQQKMDEYGRRLHDLRSVGALMMTPNQLEQSVKEIERKRATLLARAFYRQQERQSLEENIVQTQEVIPQAHGENGNPPDVSLSQSSISLPCESGSKVVQINGQSYLMVVRKPSENKQTAPSAPISVLPSQAKNVFSNNTGSFFVAEEAPNLNTAPIAQVWSSPSSVVINSDRYQTQSSIPSHSNYESANGFGQRGAVGGTKLVSESYDQGAHKQTAGNPSSDSSSVSINSSGIMANAKYATKVPLCNADRMAKLKADSRSQRVARLKQCFEKDCQSLGEPSQRQVPFASHEDAIVRLLPYHLEMEDDYSERFFERADSGFRTFMREMYDKIGVMSAKFRNSLMKESMNATLGYEDCLLNYLMHHDETDLLDADKAAAEQDLAEFVLKSEILTNKESTVDRVGLLQTQHSGDLNKSSGCAENLLPNLPEPPYNSPDKSLLNSSEKSLNNSSEKSNSPEKSLRVDSDPLRPLTADERCISEIQTSRWEPNIADNDFGNRFEAKKVLPIRVFLKRKKGDGGNKLAWEASSAKSEQSETDDLASITDSVDLKEESEEDISEDIKSHSSMIPRPEPPPVTERILNGATGGSGPRLPLKIRIKLEPPDIVEEPRTLKKEPKIPRLKIKLGQNGPVIQPWKGNNGRREETTVSKIKISEILKRRRDAVKTLSYTGLESSDSEKSGSDNEDDDEPRKLVISEVKREDSFSEVGAAKTVENKKEERIWARTPAPDLKESLENDYFPQKNSIVSPSNFEPRNLFTPSPENEKEAEEERTKLLTDAAVQWLKEEENRGPKARRDGNDRLVGAPPVGIIRNNEGIFNRRTTGWSVDRGTGNAGEERLILSDSSTEITAGSEEADCAVQSILAR